MFANPPCLLRSQLLPFGLPACTARSTGLFVQVNGLLVLHQASLTTAHALQLTLASPSASHASQACRWR